MKVLQKLRKCSLLESGPEIGGNSGNSGNGGNAQQPRGLQRSHRIKRSGNRWEHTLVFEDKRLCLPGHLAPRASAGMPSTAERPSTD